MKENRDIKIIKIGKYKHILVKTERLDGETQPNYLDNFGWALKRIEIELPN